MFFNKALIYGNITRDVELKQLPSGSEVASFSVATNRVYKDKDGQKQEQAEFHNIVVFGKQAASVAQYLGKGRSVFIEGRLQTRSWEKDGEKKYLTEIVADNVQFGPKRSGEESEKTDGDWSQAEPKSAPDYPAEEINPDDIPF